MRSIEDQEERIKAVLLLSGGLDRTLAARMMLDQDVELLFRRSYV